MRWAFRDMQANFYSQAIYKEVIGIYKKSIEIYQIRINPPRNMLGSIIYKTSVSLMKTTVKIILGMCSILSEKTPV